MTIDKFKIKLASEIRTRLTGADSSTPILDRLELHVKDFDGVNVQDIIGAKNMNHDIYISFLLQICYPAKPIKIKSVIVDGVPQTSPGGDRDYIISILNLLSVEEYNSWKKEENPVYFSTQKEYDSIPSGDFKNRLKLTNFGEYFDTSFNGNNPTPSFPSFIKRLNKHTDKEFKYELIIKGYKYE